MDDLSFDSLSALHDQKVQSTPQPLLDEGDTAIRDHEFYQVRLHQRVAVAPLSAAAPILTTRMPVLRDVANPFPREPITMQLVEETPQQATFFFQGLDYRACKALQLSLAFYKIMAIAPQDITIHKSSAFETPQMINFRTARIPLKLDPWAFGDKEVVHLKLLVHGQDFEKSYTTQPHTELLWVPTDAWTMASNHPGATPPHPSQPQWEAPSHSMDMSSVTSEDHPSLGVPAETTTASLPTPVALVEPGQLPTLYLLLRPPAAQIQTQPETLRMFEDSSAIPKLFVTAMASKKSEGETGKALYSIAHAWFDNRLDWAWMNDQQWADFEPKWNKDNVQDDQLMTGSTLEFATEAALRETHTKPAPILPHVACPVHVFDLEAKEGEGVPLGGHPNGQLKLTDMEDALDLIVKRPWKCNRCATCVRADLSRRLYVRVADEPATKGFYFTLRTTNRSITAACLIVRVLYDLAVKQTSDSWRSMVHADPQSSPTTSHAQDLPTHQEDFYHVAGERRGEAEYRQLSNLYTTCFQNDARWTEVMKDPELMYKANSLPSFRPLSA